MKKQLLFLIGLSFLFLGNAKAQDLRIPNTPAFSILGYEPTAVMRPTSAKKLSSDLLNSFDENGKLIMNLGLEVTPYWLKNRPDLTREKYLNATPGQTILQTFMISAATVKDSITKKNNLGVGFRFKIFKGKLSPKMEELEKKELDIESTIGVITSLQQMNLPDGNAVASKLPDFLKIANVAPEKITEITKKAQDLLQNQDIAKSSAKFCDELQKNYIKEGEAMVSQIWEMEDKRTGFNLETAGAAKFATSNTNNAFQKAGFWINANYYVSENDALTITARMMTNTSDTTSVNSDLGISYIRHEKDFNVSLEAMARWYRTEIPDLNQMNQPITRLEKDFTYRVAGQISYRISEDASINLSLGKDFDSPIFKGSGIFSILGINYTIFKHYNP